MKAKFLTYTILAVTLLALHQSCKTRTETEANQLDFTRYVDPFIGTDGTGHTNPAATVPFGMVQVGPDNGKSGWDWSSGYHYSSDSIVGFSHTHLSGTGIGDLLDISFLPTAIPVEYNPDDSSSFDISKYYSTFSHENEISEPGYYSVKLDNSDIKVELTATKRTAFHKYTFNQKSTATVLIDLGFEQNTDKTIASHIKVVSDTLVSGFRYSSGWAKNQKVFFAARFSKLIKEHHIIVPDSLGLGDENSKEAKRLIGAFMFDVDSETPLLVKVGISSVSEENAVININNENTNWIFEDIRNKAKSDWNKELGKIIINDKSDTNKRIFYTSFYHTMLAPTLLSDSVVSNKNEYRSHNDEIISDTTFSQYSTFSLWDTYRAAHPLLTILNPKKVNNFVRAMLAHYRDTGLLPVWTLWGNETNTMIGYHAIPVITDAYMKGLINDIDSTLIYDAMMASAYQSIREIPQYREFGYIPADTLHNSVSKTLEYAYDDWCIAQIANKMRQNVDHNLFRDRANNYKNLFDSASMFFRARMSDGTWKDPFDPLNASYENDYTEGNAWQYLWSVPHDIPGLISLLGGETEFENKLDAFFTMASDMNVDAAVDVSGLIGQYAHGNEPSHHIAYLYNYVSKPRKVQQRVRQIMDQMYSDKPDGLCGNEDCGQMSAWYILSAMGFYPVNPANGQYDLGIPLFDKMELKLENGNIFNILKTGETTENKYAVKYMLNGEPLESLYITHNQIMAGGTFEFVMGN